MQDAAPDAADADVGAEDEPLGEGEMDADVIAEQRAADDFASAQEVQPELELPEGLDLGDEEAEASGGEGGDEGDGAGPDESVPDAQDSAVEQKGAIAARVVTGLAVELFVR